MAPIDASNYGERTMAPATGAIVAAVVVTNYGAVVNYDTDDYGHGAIVVQAIAPISYDHSCTWAMAWAEGHGLEGFELSPMGASAWTSFENDLSCEFYEKGRAVSSEVLPRESFFAAIANEKFTTEGRRVVRPFAEETVVSYRITQSRLDAIFETVGGVLADMHTRTVKFTRDNDGVWALRHNLVVAEPESFGPAKVVVSGKDPVLPYTSGVPHKPTGEVPNPSMVRNAGFESGPLGVPFRSQAKPWVMGTIAERAGLKV